MHREMRIDDLYNEGKVPWSKERRNMVSIVVLNSRPWDKNVHGEDRLTAKSWYSVNAPVFAGTL